MTVAPELILIGVLGLFLLGLLFDRGMTEPREIIIVQTPPHRPAGCARIIALLVVMLLAILLVALFSA
ncbi:MAG: hypothetical protein ACLFVO_23860 [Chloroflexaceae bacterium]